MAHITFEIQELYRRTFGTRPVVPSASDTPTSTETLPVITAGLAPGQTTPRGRTLYETYRGTEVWLPVKLFAAFRSSGSFSAVLSLANGSLYLPYTVVRATCKKNIISTPLAERQGTVKELYSIDDWQISVKGFLISPTSWPEEDIARLNEFFKMAVPLKIENALTDVLLENATRPEEQCRVVMESLEFLEVEGGKIRAQAFSMKLVSDSVFTLEWEGE